MRALSGGFDAGCDQLGRCCDNGGTPRSTHCNIPRRFHHLSLSRRPIRPTAVPLLDLLVHSAECVHRTLDPKAKRSDQLRCFFCLCGASDTAYATEEKVRSQLLMVPPGVDSPHTRNRVTVTVTKHCQALSSKARERRRKRVVETEIS